MNRHLAILAAALALLLISGCAPAGDVQPADPAPTTSPRQAFEDDSGRTAAVLTKGTLYLSAVAPANAPAPIDEQTHSAMQRLGTVLDSAGLDYPHVVSCHVQLADMEHYATMNEIYGSYFATGSYPARTTLAYPGLPSGASVMLTCIAHEESSEIEVIHPSRDSLPAALGPYSPAVRAGRTVYLSGQGGRNPATGELGATAGDQARQALENIGSILDAAGLSFDNTAFAGSYLTQASDLAATDSAFEAIFSEGGAPSRADVVLSALPGGIAVEITFVAVDDDYLTRLFMHDQAPTALSSPISQSGDTAYTATMHGAGNSFRKQFFHALDSSKAVLQLGSLSLANVVRLTVGLSDLADLSELHSLIREAFPDQAPAVSAVQAHLPDLTMLSLEMIAVR